MFSIESLFKYNWQIRDEWFEILEPIAEIELLRERNAGIGSIMKTLFHIIDVEYSWIRAIKNEPDVTFDCEEYKDIKSMRTLSDKLRIENKELLTNWSMDMEYERVTPEWDAKI
ncbi:DinB family protein, partial [Paenibacillus macquariensis]|uniref:DinB family protein n=1 Tax=Paenibacillus macquariensis TaxID=948756 RepID=UPI001470CBF6